jgi:hypothetical protein
MWNLLLVAVLIFCLGSAGCSGVESEWVKAGKDNTAKSYRNYLAAFPNGPHTGEVQRRIDESEWTTARLTNTVAAYDQYLAAHPTGSHTKEASDARDFRSASAQNTADDYITYIGRHPAGSFLAEARDLALKADSIVLTDLQQGYVTITKGWSGGFESSTRDGRPYSPESIEEVQGDGAGWVFHATDFQLRSRNIVLVPRIPCTSLYIFRNRTKGAEVYGYDIYLRGKSGDAPVHKMSSGDETALLTAQANAPHRGLGFRMPRHDLSCKVGSWN